MKRCPKCGVEKEKGVGFGTSGWCKLCLCAHTLARYHGDAEHREKVKARHRVREAERRADPEWNEQTLAALRDKRASDPAWRQRQLDIAKASRHRRVGRHLCQSARTRSKRCGRECTITPAAIQELWEASPFCAYCSKPLVPSDNTHAHDSPSLERVDQTKGYTPENTVFACYRCNILKRDATVEELEALAVNVRRVLSRL
jgi:hypothetical protein